MSFTNPAPTGQEGRTDQGVDWSNITGQVYTVAKGTITNIYTGLSGFGTTIIEKLTNGESVYYALETGADPLRTILPGQAVSQGQPLASGRGTGGIEVGFWNPATGRAVAAPQYTSEGVATAAGQAFRNRIRITNTPAAQTNAPTPTQTLSSLWIQAGGDPKLANLMAAIALAESGGRVNAQSPKNTNGTYDYGLWQINSSHNYDKQKLLSDPLYNARAAVAIEKSQGLTAWSTYTSGAYTSYLTGAGTATPSYGGTRPGGGAPGSGSGASGGGGGGAADLNAAYATLRDTARQPSGPQDVGFGGSPFGWFLGVWKSEWDAVSGGLKTAGEAFGDTTRAIGDVVKFMEALPFYTLRAVELIFGAILLWLGLKQSSTAARQTGSNLGHLTREVVLSTPGIGAEVRAAQGRRMGRREGQREAARISARGAEVARRRREQNP